MAGMAHRFFNDKRSWWSSWGSWAGAVVIGAALVVDLTQRTAAPGIDFHTYLAAARVGLQSGWQNIYDQDLVATAQQQLAPSLAAQPFLSPAPVAWLAAPLTALSYQVALDVWVALAFAAFAAAVIWAARLRNVQFWVAAGATLASWWVIHALELGQVVPFVAAAVIVAWGLLRERHDVAAGLALVLVLLKPNTAILVPLALLAAGRVRVFASWLAGAALVGLVAALTLGNEGMSAYASQLTSTLPTGADFITLHGAFGITGAPATILRVLFVAGAIAAAYRMRGSPGLVVPLGVLASLIVSPYLHASDLILLGAAAWMVWEERPGAMWRVPLALGWLPASPFLFAMGRTPDLARWPLIEIALWLAIVVAAWGPLTARADRRSRATA